MTLKTVYAALACAAALSVAQAAAADAPTVTVTGVGEVQAAPDMATIRLGVTEEAEEARLAMDAVSAAMTDVLARLTGFGIEGRDIQTQGLSLHPVRDHGGASTGGAPEIVGYRASNDLRVRVRDLDGLGGVLDAVLEDGANTLGGLSFGVADPAPLMREARAAAVRDAMNRAETYAEAAEIDLGPVMSISEVGGAQPMPRMMEAARADAMPIAAGEIALSASVTVVFGLDD